MQAKHIQSAVRQAVEAAIEAAEKASAAENPDEKAMAEAKVALDEAVTAIEASAAVYDVLADALRYAGQVKDWYEEDEEKRGKMETAIKPHRRFGRIRNRPRSKSDRPHRLCRMSRRR